MQYVHLTWDNAVYTSHARLPYNLYCVGGMLNHAFMDRWRRLESLEFLLGLIEITKEYWSTLSRFAKASKKFKKKIITQ